MVRQTPWSIFVNTYTGVFLYASPHTFRQLGRNASPPALASARTCGDMRPANSINNY